MFATFFHLRCPINVHISLLLYVEDTHSKLSSDTWSTSQTTLHQYLDWYLVHTKLTLNWPFDDQQVINTWSMLAWQLAEYLPTHLYWLTLNSVSTKIIWLSADCRPRCYVNVDQELMEMLMECWSKVNQGYWLTRTQIFFLVHVI